MAENSLILPIYRAEAFLQKTLARLDPYLAQEPGKPESGKWELILVVDSSTDRSAEICQNFAAERHPFPVQVIVNEQNQGKGASVRRGMLAASGAYRIFTDCDLPYALEDIDHLLDHLKNGAMVAVASRVHPDSRYTIGARDLRYLHTRHLMSRLFNRLVRWFILPGCNDTQAGLKGFRSEAADYLFSQQRLTGFSFDLELLHLAHRAGWPLVEIPIHYRYQEEPSTVDFASDALRMLRDMVQIRSGSAAGRYQPFGKRQIKLVIHADDFGLNDGITDGILEAIAKGSVTSTSALLNFPASPRALQLAREHGVDVGWHINFTLGRPVAPPETIPTLVRADGSFHPLKSLLLRALARRIDSEDVKRELVAQWELFAQARIQPSHIDGHQHVHVFPVIREVVKNFVSQQKIPFVRIPNEPWGITAPRLLGRWLLRSFRGAHPAFWNVRTPIAFRGFGLMQRAGDIEAWRHLLNLMVDPVVEVMVHPGKPGSGQPGSGKLRPGNELYGDDFPGDREAEWALLTGPEWKKMIEEQNFTLVSFRDLRMGPA